MVLFTTNEWSAKNRPTSVQPVKHTIRKTHGEKRKRTNEQASGRCKQEEKRDQDELACWVRKHKYKQDRSMQGKPFSEANTESTRDKKHDRAHWIFPRNLTWYLYETGNRFAKMNFFFNVVLNNPWSFKKIIWCRKVKASGNTSQNAIDEDDRRFNRHYQNWLGCSSSDWWQHGHVGLPKTSLNCFG